MQAQTLVLAPSSPVQGEVLGELSVFLRDNGFESGWDAEIRAELDRIEAGSMRGSRADTVPLSEPLKPRQMSLTPGSGRGPLDDVRHRWALGGRLGGSAESLLPPIGVTPSTPFAPSGSPSFWTGGLGSHVVVASPSPPQAQATQKSSPRVRRVTSDCCERRVTLDGGDRRSDALDPLRSLDERVVPRPTPRLPPVAEQVLSRRASDGVDSFTLAGLLRRLPQKASTTPPASPRDLRLRRPSISICHRSSGSSVHAGGSPGLPPLAKGDNAHNHQASTHYTLKIILALTTHHPLTTHHSPLTTHHPPLTTHYSPITHHPPPTTHLLTYSPTHLLTYSPTHLLITRCTPQRRSVRRAWRATALSSS